MTYRYVLYIAAPVYLFGFLWFILPGDYSIRDQNVQQHVYAAAIFIVSFFFGGVIAHCNTITTSEKVRKIKMTREQALHFNRLLTIAGWFSCFFIMLYIMQNSFEKILAIGSNLEGSEFRYIGLDHKNKLIQMPMELSRRAVMPFIILSKLLINRLHFGIGKISLIIFVTIFFIASIINLDRGPVFIFIAMFGFYYWRINEGLFKKIMVFLLFLVLIAVIGWFFTLAQYNSLALLNLRNFYDTLFGLIINRIILSPVIMAQTWVFDFSDAPLYLEYARISVLWGNEYVGSHDTYSHHVAPVGIIGDIQRNFGLNSMFISGIIVGFIFKVVENSVRKSPLEAQISLNFVEFVLAIYLIHGGLFSMGPPALLVFLLVASIVLRKLYPRLG